MFKLSNDINELHLEFTKANAPRSALSANTVSDPTPQRPHNTPKLLPEAINLDTSLNMSNDNQNGDTTDYTNDENVPPDTRCH